MPIEVEQKYPVADRSALLQRINALAVIAEPAVTQVDAYYAHPARDFATTDEALRIRRVGEQNVITYKGPKFNTSSKTRREIELPLAAGELSMAEWDELLTALSFRSVAVVTKVRQIFRLLRDGRDMELALDQVLGVGDYAEIEIVVHDESEIKPAEQLIQALASELQLAGAEHRSYLELLLGQ